MRESLKHAGQPILMDPNNKDVVGRAVLSRIASCILLSLALLCLIESDLTNASVSGQPPRRGVGSDTAVRLVLRTTTTHWPTKNTNEISVYLENFSDTPYYVGGRFPGLGIISSFHYIDLKIIDERGRDVSGPRVSVTQMWDPGTTVVQKAAAEYIKLEKNMIHGLTLRGDWQLQPGRYRLSATYHEIEAKYWTNDEKRSLSAPVWTQPLFSNTVIIQVSRMLNYRGKNGKTCKEEIFNAK